MRSMSGGRTWSFSQCTYADGIVVQAAAVRRSVSDRMLWGRSRASACAASSSDRSE
jgi:hypothetical protein